jgi:hypothetical protein
MHRPIVAVAAMLALLVASRVAGADTGPPGLQPPSSIPARCGRAVRAYAEPSVWAGFAGGPTQELGTKISPVALAHRLAAGVRFRRCDDGVERLELRLAAFGQIMMPLPLAGFSAGLEAEASLPLDDGPRIGLHAAWAVGNVINEDHPAWLSAGLRLRHGNGWFGIDAVYSSGIPGYYTSDRIATVEPARALVFGAGFEGKHAHRIVIIEALVVALIYALSRGEDPHIT